MKYSEIFDAMPNHTVHIEEEDNAPTIILVNVPDRSTVSMGVFVRFGSFHEIDPKEYGVAHFIEHMLFKGTENRDKTEIAQEVEGVGGTYNAYTTYDHTAFYIHTLLPYLYESFDVLMDIILHPTFPKEEYHKEKLVIMEEIKASLDNPGDYSYDQFHTWMWGDTSRSHQITGDLSGIKKMKMSVLENAFKRHYVANNIAIVLVGSFEIDKFLTNFKNKYAASFKVGKITDPYPRISEKSFPKSPSYIEKKDFEQLWFWMGHIFPESKTLIDLATRHIANIVIGGNSSSRLFQNIREEHGLAYSIGSFWFNFIDSGLMMIHSNIDPKRYEEFLISLQKEFDLLSNIDDKEINDAKLYLTGSLLKTIDNPKGLMMWLGKRWLKGESLIVRQHLAAALQVNKENVTALLTNSPISIENGWYACIGSTEGTA